MSCTLFAQGSENVPLLLHLNPYPNVGYNDCWGYTAPDGREYALLGVQTGTSIIDITDVDRAAEVAFISGAKSLWKDIKTYRQYAYVVTEANTTMQIIDLSDLPNSAAIVATYSGFETSPHNIFIDEEMGILYGAEDFNFNHSVRVISLADPLAPVEVANFGPDSHDMFAQNATLFVAEGINGTFSIYNMQNPAQPQLITRFNIPAPGYVHNIWASRDNRFVMTTEETREKTVKLWNIRNTSNIRLTDDYLAPNNLAHNVFIKGDFAYLSHYQSGLRILDISDSEFIREIGYYETPDAWGTYPFFESGKILISDIFSGLYVVYFSGADESSNPEEPPEEFLLTQNYPNPFNGLTRIDYHLPRQAQVSITVYNLPGQPVRQLENTILPEGIYHVKWDGRDDAGRLVSAGIFFYRMVATVVDDGSTFTRVNKMIFVQ